MGLQLPRQMVKITHPKAKARKQYVSIDEHSQRIEALELKLMDVENTVQELNEVILRQYRDIERLQLQQEELLRRSTGGAASGAVPTASDELPPHY